MSEAKVSSGGAGLQWLGHSSDLRTNRWRITCPRCAKAFEPQTTMFATQVLTCPARQCNASIFVDYNAQAVSIFSKD